MKKLLSINVFLGTSMLMFGVLKFFNPFKSWYTTQIVNSGMGDLSYLLGITGEITAGGLLLYATISTVTRKNVYGLIVILSSALIVFMMTTGVYVHMHPEVPADVLPLKIKPPYIPLIFLMLALFNIWKVRKELKS
ncbi:MAG: hypothetical protein NVV82_14045 [Sporocytophaga sp.]|nr:hypothetical protein [Sporocytophaga sp.]